MARRHFELSEDAIKALRQAEQSTRDVHALKRLQGVRLYGSGQPLRVIQDMLNCGESSVREWVQRYQTAGVDGLQSQWRGGNANKLSAAQRADLTERLHQYRPDQVLPAARRVSQGHYWTVSDLKVAVQAWYRVSYQDDDSYQQLFQRCGFSYQRAERVYRSRPSPADIAAFEAELEKK